MKNEYHDLEVGQKVVCINEDFPPMEEYGTKERIKVHPKKGDVLVIDDVLGEFLTFDEYNDENTTEWFYHNRFKPIDDTESIEAAMMTREILYLHF